MKFNEDLYFGLSGYKVVNLQNALKIKGFFNYNSTGYFGPISFLAVKKFQKSNGIPTTGYFGPLSRACMNKLFGL
jgi:N-acetylmuramoyl-L-alanine amidase